MPIKPPLRMKLAPLLETLLGTLSLPQELLSQKMLKLIHIQDMLNICNLLLRLLQLEKVLLEKDSLVLLTSKFHLLPTPALMQIRLLLKMKHAPLMETQPGTLSLLLELLSQLMQWLNHTQDMLNISKLISIVDHPILAIHYMFQQMEDILRLAQIRELPKHLMLPFKLLQLILMHQRLLDGIKIVGTRLDLKNPSSVTINILKASFNLMLKPLQLVKVLLEKDSLELLISKSLLQPTPVLTLTKPLPKMRIAPLMETPPGTLSPPLELPNQLMPWLNHTQDILNTESIKR
jgi:hypothetical protein